MSLCNPVIDSLQHYLFSVHFSHLEFYIIFSKLCDVDSSDYENTIQFLQDCLVNTVHIYIYIYKYSFFILHSVPQNYTRKTVVRLWGGYM